MTSPLTDEQIITLAQTLKRPPPHECAPVFITGSNLGYRLFRSGGDHAHVNSEDLILFVRAVEKGMGVEHDNLRKANLDCMDHFNALMADYEKAQATMRLALEALRLPCNYWNKRQFEIVNAAIAALKKELACSPN